MYNAKHVIVEQKEPNTKRITDNVALGENLKDNVRGAIEKTINIQENEKLEIVYIYNDTFDIKFNIVTDTIVGITNLRIFKIENARCDSQNLHDIVGVEHQKNGMFRWDKVICYLAKSGQQNTFGIYHADVCKYFCSYIDGKIKKRNEIVV